jgi:hypothetical protein
VLFAASCRFFEGVGLFLLYDAVDYAVWWCVADRRWGSVYKGGALQTGDGEVYIKVVRSRGLIQ